MFTKVFDPKGKDIICFNIDDDFSILKWIELSIQLKNTVILAKDVYAKSEITKDKVFGDALVFPCTLVESEDEK